MTFDFLTFQSCLVNDKIIFKTFFRKAADSCLSFLLTEKQTNTCKTFYLRQVLSVLHSDEEGGVLRRQAMWKLINSSPR